MSYNFTGLYILGSKNAFINVFGTIIMLIFFILEGGMALNQLSRKHSFCFYLLISISVILWMFHPHLIYRSSRNIAKLSRDLIVIAYNSVGNLPTRRTRPDFMCLDNASPLISNNTLRLSVI